LEDKALSGKVSLLKQLLRRETMTSNSELIIQDIRQDFETLLDFVTGEQAQTATADQVEQGLFKLLLALGAKLLGLFFAMRSAACDRQRAETLTGQRLPYAHDRKRDYYSIFGKIPLWRPYFYRQGEGSVIPLDEALALGEDCYSDLLREVLDYLGVYNVYHKSSQILARLLGLSVSTGAIEANMATDAAEVEAYYAQKPAPQPAQEAAILVIQADGKGVPMVLAEVSEPKVRLGKGQKRGHKKEAIVTTVYTIKAQPRRPAAVVASFFQPHLAPSKRPDPATRPKPQHKHIWATLDGKETALARLAQQVATREGDHIQHRVALGDGCEALQSRLLKQFPDFTLILDFIHAEEYLWDVANALLGEHHPHRDQWVAAQTLQLLSGQTQSVIASFRQIAQTGQVTPSQQAQLIKTANYFQRNLPFMDYATYLHHGWPIASGVIEGACRHFVKDRCELSGMRWTQAGVENLLRLRAVAENGDWEAYHAFRKSQRFQRLYGRPYPDQPPLELQGLTTAPASPDHVLEPVCPAKNRQDYQHLPLAA
jgi:hypothetical protein